LFGFVEVGYNEYGDSLVHQRFDWSHYNPRISCVEIDGCDFVVVLVVYDLNVANVAAVVCDDRPPSYPHHIRHTENDRVFNFSVIFSMFLHLCIDNSRARATVVLGLCVEADVQDGVRVLDRLDALDTTTTVLYYVYYRLLPDLYARMLHFQTHCGPCTFAAGDSSRHSELSCLLDMSCDAYVGRYMLCATSVCTPLLDMFARDVVIHQAMQEGAGQVCVHVFSPGWGSFLQWLSDAYRIHRCVITGDAFVQPISCRLRADLLELEFVEGYTSVASCADLCSFVASARIKHLQIRTMPTGCVFTNDYVSIITIYTSSSAREFACHRFPRAWKLNLHGDYLLRADFSGCPRLCDAYVWFRVQYDCASVYRLLLQKIPTLVFPPAMYIAGKPEDDVIDLTRELVVQDAPHLLPWVRAWMPRAHGKFSREFNCLLGAFLLAMDRLEPLVDPCVLEEIPRRHPLECDPDDN